MNPFNQQFMNAFKNVRLTSSEKLAHRNALLAEIASNPLPIAASVRKDMIARHVYSRKSLIHNKLFTRMPIAVLIVMLMGGGISFAAADTIPGDALYPVKIHVNENIESALTVGDNAKAKLEINLALRRLDEAQQLEAKQQLDTKTKVALKSNFDAHTQDLEKRLKSVEKNNQEDADNISSEFETSLHGYVRALGLLGVEVNQSNTQEITHENSEARTEATTAASIHATTSLKKKPVDVLLNAVFRSNDDADAQKDEDASNSDINVMGNTHDEHQQDGMGTGANGEGKSSGSTHAGMNGSTSIDLNNTVKVNSDTHVELEHDKDGQNNTLELNGSGSSNEKIKLGL